MTTQEYDKMLIYLNYYSYDRNGEKTISIHYYNYPWYNKPYAITCNGGVAIMWLSEGEFAQACRVCAREHIIIDTINEH